MKTEGTVPPNGELEWLDYPYIAKRLADEAIKKNSDRLILRQSFRLKNGEEILEIYCDTTYLLDPSKIANISLPPKISLVRATRKPIPLDAKDEKGRPVLPWVEKEGFSLDNPQIAKVEGGALIGLQVGTTFLHFDNGRIKGSTTVEVTPAIGDEKVLPPFLRLLSGEKRFIFLDNLPPEEITGFVIRDKSVASRGEIDVIPKDEWNPGSAFEEDIKDVKELIEGKNSGRTKLIVRGLKSGAIREGEIEVVNMSELPMNRWRLAMFIFPNTEVEVEGKKEVLSYKPEEIEGIKEAARRLPEIVRYFTGGNLAMDVSLAVAEKERITNDLIEDTKVYGYRVNMNKAEPLLERLSEELFAKPLSYFDDVVVCSPMPQAGAAWGGWEFNIEGAIVRGLYIPNYWREGTPIWGDMVEVLLHEWIHCLEGHIVRSGLKPIPSADAGAAEGEVLSNVKDPTFRRPKEAKTWMPYYLHLLRDFLTPDDWARLQTRYKKNSAIDTP